LKICEDIRNSRCTTGVKDVGGKMTTGVIFIGSKFTADVNDKGW
jgi:hypothetical protein